MPVPTIRAKVEMWFGKNTRWWLAPKDIPPYAVAVGCPIKIIKYRFDEERIEALKRIKWWEFDEERLKEVEHFFFDVDGFIKKQNQLSQNG